MNSNIRTDNVRNKLWFIEENRLPYRKLSFQDSSNFSSAILPFQFTFSIAPLIMEKWGTVCPISISQMTGMSGNALRTASS